MNLWTHICFSYIHNFVPSILGQKTGHVSFKTLFHFLSLICPANSQIILQYAGICLSYDSHVTCMQLPFKPESNHVFDGSQLGPPNDRFLQNNYSENKENIA